MVSYGGIVFKIVDILSNFAHPCLFHSASFELVLFLEEVTLSHPRYNAVSQDAFLVSVQ